MYYRSISPTATTPFLFLTLTFTLPYYDCAIAGPSKFSSMKGINTETLRCRNGCKVRFLWVLQYCTVRFADKWLWNKSNLQFCGKLFCWGNAYHASILYNTRSLWCSLWLGRRRCSTLSSLQRHLICPRIWSKREYNPKEDHIQSRIIDLQQPPKRWWSISESSREGSSNMRCERRRSLARKVPMLNPFEPSTTPHPSSDMIQKRT